MSISKNSNENHLYKVDDKLRFLIIACVHLQRLLEQTNFYFVNIAFYKSEEGFCQSFFSIGISPYTKDFIPGKGNYDEKISTDWCHLLKGTTYTIEDIKKAQPLLDFRDKNSHCLCKAISHADDELYIDKEKIELKLKTGKQILDRKFIKAHYPVVKKTDLLMDKLKKKIHEII